MSKFHDRCPFTENFTPAEIVGSLYLNPFLELTPVHPKNMNWSDPTASAPIMPGQQQQPEIESEEQEEELEPPYGEITGRGLMKLFDAFPTSRAGIGKSVNRKSRRNRNRILDQQREPDYQESVQERFDENDSSEPIIIGPRQEAQETPEPNLGPQQNMNSEVNGSIITISGDDDVNKSDSLDSIQTDQDPVTGSSKQQEFQLDKSVKTVTVDRTDNSTLENSEPVIETTAHEPHMKIHATSFKTEKNEQEIGNKNDDVVVQKTSSDSTDTLKDSNLLPVSNDTDDSKLIPSADDSVVSNQNSNQDARTSQIQTDLDQKGDHDPNAYQQSDQNIDIPESSNLDTDINNDNQTQQADPDSALQYESHEDFNEQDEEQEDEDEEEDEEQNPNESQSNEKDADDHTHPDSKEKCYTSINSWFDFNDNKEQDEEEFNNNATYQDDLKEYSPANRLANLKRMLEEAGIDHELGSKSNKVTNNKDHKSKSQSNNSHYPHISPEYRHGRYHKIGSGQNKVFCDLGSGTGRSVFNAVIQQGFKEAIGIEKDIFRWRIAQRARNRFVLDCKHPGSRGDVDRPYRIGEEQDDRGYYTVASPASQSHVHSHSLDRTQFIHADFFDRSNDISKCDTVLASTLIGMPSQDQNEWLAEKLYNNLKPGAVVFFDNPHFLNAWAELSYPSFLKMRKRHRHLLNPEYLEHLEKTHKKLKKYNLDNNHLFLNGVNLDDRVDFNDWVRTFRSVEGVQTSWSAKGIEFWGAKVPKKDVDNGEPIEISSML